MLRMQSDRTHRKGVQNKEPTRVLQVQERFRAKPNLQLFKSQLIDVDGGPSMNDVPESPKTLESQYNPIRSTEEIREERKTNNINKSVATTSNQETNPQEPLSVSAFVGRHAKGATLAELSVNGVGVSALIDTRATKSIAPESLARKLNLELDQSENQRRWILADNSSTLVVVGKSKIKLAIGKSVVVHELVFTKELAYDLIIGVDILVSLGCKIDYETGALEVGGEKIDLSVSQTKNTTVASLQESLTIEPETDQVVWVRRPEKFDCDLLVEGLRNGVIDSVCSAHEDKLLVIVRNTGKRSMSLMMPVKYE